MTVCFPWVFSNLCFFLNILYSVLCVLPTCVPLPQDMTHSLIPTKTVPHFVFKSSAFLFFSTFIIFSIFGPVYLGFCYEWLSCPVLLF